MNSKLEWQIMLVEGVVNTAKQLQSDSGKLKETVPVAANNIQIAASAFAKLAADVGAMNNIVASLDLDSEIESNTDEAMDKMNAAAYLAEQASEFSMGVAVKVSESQATDGVAPANDLLGALKTLKKEGSSDYTTLKKFVVSLNQTVATAVQSAHAIESDLHKLMNNVEKLTASMQEAAEQINFTIDLIMKRKASTALISDQLVEASSVASRDTQNALSLLALEVASTRTALGDSGRTKGTADMLQADIQTVADELACSI